VHPDGSHLGPDPHHPAGQIGAFHRRQALAAQLLQFGVENPLDGRVWVTLGVFEGIEEHRLNGTELNVPEVSLLQKNEFDEVPVEPEKLVHQNLNWVVQLRLTL